MGKDYKASGYEYKAIWVLTWFRIGNKIKHSTIPSFIKKILLVVFKLIYIVFVEIPFNVELPFGVNIGEGLRLNHTYGIVLNSNVIIGKNCTIFQQVTIGAVECKGITDKAPQLGDNVYIGAGAKILGDIIIGDNVKIGANAVVTKDVPSNSTVVGNPMKIISKEKQVV